MKYSIQCCGGAAQSSYRVVQGGIGEEEAASRPIPTQRISLNSELPELCRWHHECSNRPPHWQHGANLGITALSRPSAVMVCHNFLPLLANEFCLQQRVVIWLFPITVSLSRSSWKLDIDHYPGKFWEISSRIQLVHQNGSGHTTLAQFWNLKKICIILEWWSNPEVPLFWG